MFGIARVVRTLAASLAERGHVVRVLTPTAGPPEVAFEGRVWVHRVPPAARSGVALHPVAAQARAFAAELAAVEERLPIDLVQVPNWDAPGLEAIAEGRWRVVVGLYTPVLAMVESDHRFDTRDALIRLLEARELALYASATAFLACGARIVDEIERDYGVRLRDRPVGVVPHGLPDLARPEPAPIGDGSVRILCVGRLEPRKGTDVLLEAAARVLAEAPDTRLDIVGDAGSGGHARSYPSLWRELAGGSEVEARTTFLGQVDNATLLRHYARADVVVVPSRFESFGLTAIEAMRFGVPAVVTATGEMQDIVADAGCGLVVPPADADALATALLELVRSPERRRVLGETGRTAFAQRYTRERMAEEVERFYREVRRDAQPATGLVPALAGALAAAAPEPLDRVACPTCHGPVEARADLLAGGRPWSATLRCAACAAPVGAIRHGMVDARAGTLPGDAPAAAGPPLELPALRRRRLRAAAPEVEASGAWAVIDGGRRAAVEGARLEVEVVCASAGALLRRVPDGGTARLHVDGAHVADVDLDGAGEELEVELLAGSAPARHVLAVEIAAPAPGGRRGPVHVAGFALDVVALDGLDDVPQPGRGQAQAAPPAAVASRLVDLPPGAAVLRARRRDAALGARARPLRLGGRRRRRRDRRRAPPPLRRRHVRGRPRGSRARAARAPGRRGRRAPARGPARRRDRRRGRAPRAAERRWHAPLRHHTGRARAALRRLRGARDRLVGRPRDRRPPAPARHRRRRAGSASRARRARAAGTGARRPRHP